MQPDYLSHKRAVSVSLLGLVLQLAMAGALMVYGNRYAGDDPPAFTAAFFTLVGALAWLALLIVSDQHRRERLEAMDAESLAASGAAASSVFEAGAGAQGAGGEFRVAYRRLLGLYKWFYPGVSLLIAGALIGLGVWRFLAAEGVMDRRMPEVQPAYGWGIAIGLFCAVAGFVFARFVAGMARQPVWKSLRGGADFAVGSALMGLALAVAHFADLAGPDTVFRWLHVIFPVFMIVLGGEIILNFLLDLYRPRRAGELPRPAFDSRLLAFVSAPDVVARSVGEALSYQFGYDITSNWFYRLMSRYIGPLVGVAAIVLWGMSALAVVAPHQRSLITRFGAVQREVGPGLHLKMPWPIDRVEVPVHETRDDRGRIVQIDRTVTGIRTLNLASPPPARDRAVLWTNEHAGEEVYFIVQPAPAGEAAGGSARDIALIAAEVPLRFRVSSVEKYDRLAGAEAMRTGLLTSVAQREMLRHLAPLSVIEVLGEARLRIQTELRGRIQAAFDALGDGGAGVEVLSVELKGVHPPRDVAPSFERVLQAQQNQQARLLRAQADAIQTLTRVVGSVDLATRIAEEHAALTRLRESGAAPEKIAEQQTALQRLIEQAGGSASAQLASARAERWVKHMDARARAARYAGHLAGYRAAPSVYTAALYFEALRDAMKDSRVYLVPDRVRMVLRLEDREQGVDVFNPGAPKE
jgi:regulator of protease activity HflC (stomatin/prohibitin superfamily)